MRKGRALCKIPWKIMKFLLTSRWFWSTIVKHVMKRFCRTQCDFSTLFFGGFTMKRIYFPLIALGLGLIGFFLRMQQLSVALSPSTGMPILHHPYSYALIALTIVGVLLPPFWWGRG